MSDRQLRQLQQDTRDRGREQRQLVERTAAEHRARLADYYARQRAARQA